MPRPPTRQSVPLLALISLALIAAFASPATATPPQPTPNVEKPSNLSSQLETLADPAVVDLPPTEQSDAAGAPQTGPGSLIRDGEAVAVQVQLDSVHPSTLGALNGVADSVTVVDEAAGLVDVTIDPHKLPALASLKGVVYASELVAPITNAVCPTGVVSEGDQQLKANLARATFGVDGSGVKVGIMSDSYNATGAAATDVYNAELPGTGNPCGHPATVSVLKEHTGKDEGRAMAQIVHDIAPGAEILFATASPSQTAFANNIRALAAAGATIIVDDITYFTEPMYQDGPIAAAIADVTKAGVAYFSSAGNSNRDVPASYEAVSFRPAQCPTAITNDPIYAGYAVSCHDFNASATIKTSWRVTAAGGQSMAMSWNEPMYGVATDLDLCMVDPASQTVIDCGDFDSIQMRQATEYVFGPAGTVDIMVVKAQGAQNPRFKIVSMSRNLTHSDAVAFGGDVVGPTAFGHNVSRATISVAAQGYNSSSIESFSSRGPALTCWGPVKGSTPAAKLPACETSTIDVTATDGTLNTFFGSQTTGGYRFYGTSAAAPHAAAVAALLKQANPSASNAAILTAMQTSAVPVSGAGVHAMGAGRVDAAAAIAALSNAQPVSAEGSSYTPVSPTRVLDTRDGLGGRVGPLSPGQKHTLTIPGLPGDATAVVLNVTAAQPSASGFLTVYPGGQATPSVSNLNFQAQDIVPNLVSVAVGPGGIVTVEPGAATTHVIADLAGYYSPTGHAGYVPLTPKRVIDTREGLGISGAIGREAVKTMTIPGLPAGTTAVTLNVTAVQPTALTYLTVFPGGSPMPLASNLNVQAGEIRANLVTVKVGPDGKVSFFNKFGSTHLVADLAGYYSTTEGYKYYPLTPSRILDTRTGVGGYSAPLGAGTAITLRPSSIPAGAQAVVANLTAVHPTAPGYLTAWPDGGARPVASNLNFVPGDVVPNLAHTATGAKDTLSIHNPSGDTHVIVDLAGYFA